MKYSYLYLLVFFALSACSPKAEKKAETLDPKLLISCEGVGDVKLKDTYADLQKKLGDSVLSEHENNVAGKFTSVWENSPKHLNIYWQESQAPFKTIKYIDVIDGMAPYMTIDSIGVGMSLKDLVKKNGGMAITFKNFSAMSEPGVIKGYNNGEIPKSNPCLGGVLEWTDQKPIDVNEMREFQAQEEIKSFDRILQRYDVVLSIIRLSPK
ncbi:hypothetical protein WG906_12780 [Pedobacter sp. P351]|uniref:hypothetical protein n=1 Tax=Pedobacter superstes TaxID=3133441 RepID=UPI0030A57952